jgi:hypothetical protein
MMPKEMALVLAQAQQIKMARKMEMPSLIQICYLYLKEFCLKNGSISHGV